MDALISVQSIIQNLFLLGLGYLALNALSDSGYCHILRGEKGDRNPASVIDNFWVLRDSRMGMFLNFVITVQNLPNSSLGFLSNLVWLQESLVNSGSRSHTHVRGFRKPVDSLWCFCSTKAVSGSSKDLAQWVA